MVVESSLDQQRTGYLVKVSLMYVMLMVDLAANSIADHTPASDGVGPLAWAGYVTSALRVPSTDPHGVCCPCAGLKPWRSCCSGWCCSY